MDFLDSKGYIRTVLNMTPVGISSHNGNILECIWNMCVYTYIYIYYIMGYTTKLMMGISGMWVNYTCGFHLNHSWFSFARDFRDERPTI